MKTGLVVIAFVCTAAVTTAAGQTSSEGVNRVLESLRRAQQQQQQGGTQSAAPRPGMPRGAAGPASVPRSEPLDVLGVQLGMPMAQAVEILKGHGMTVEILPVRLSNPEMNFPGFIRGKKVKTGRTNEGKVIDISGDKVLVWLSGPPSEPKVIMIGREFRFEAGREVAKTDLTNSLKEKYGPWITEYTWRFNTRAACGDPSSGPFHEGFLPADTYFASTDYGTFLTGKVTSSRDNKLVDGDGLCLGGGQFAHAMLSTLNRNQVDLVDVLLLTLIDKHGSQEAREATRKVIAGHQSGVRQQELQRAKERTGPAM